MQQCSPTVPGSWCVPERGAQGGEIEIFFGKEEEEEEEEEEGKGFQLQSQMMMFQRRELQ